MLPLLTTLTVASGAPWVPERLPTLVVGVGTSTRAQHRTTGSFGVGAVLHRGRHHDLVVGGLLDFGALYLFQPGFFRVSWSAGIVAEPLWVANPWLAFGPSGSLAVRTFSQLGRHIGSYVVPQVGALARLHLVQAPAWRVALQGRVLADLVRTDLLLGSANVNTFPPVGFQAWLTVAFGREIRPERA